MPKPLQRLFKVESVQDFPLHSNMFEIVDVGTAHLPDNL